MKLLNAFLLIMSPVLLSAQPQYLDLFVGTYTNTGKSEGIYVYRFDADNGTAELQHVSASENPSFLAISADREHVYVVNENGDGRGALSAYAYNGATKELRLLNQRLTEGDSPCHVATESTGTHVITANYRGGSVSVFPILPDGSLGPLVQLIKHEGNGPDKSRQNAPHVHSVFFSPDEKKLFVQDLGTDKINIYDYRREQVNNPLVPATQPFIEGAPGGGPRHIAQSANGQFIYLVQEMTARVMVYGQEGGKWSSIQEIDINTPGFEGADGAAEIKLSPDGRFLYASNRADANTLAIYQVDASSGLLTKIGNQSVLGQVPRNFTISPDGRYLLVANEKSDEVVIFARDINSGLLTDTGHRIAVGAPVCVLF